MNEQKNTTTTEKTDALTNVKKKFSSRKFLLSLAGVVTGIAGMIGCNDNTIAVVAFVVLEVLSIVSYLICEGKIDAAAVDKGMNIAKEIMDAINAAKENDKSKLPEHNTGKDYIDGLPLSADSPAGIELEECGGTTEGPNTSV